MNDSASSLPSPSSIVELEVRRTGNSGIQKDRIKLSVTNNDLLWELSMLEDASLLCICGCLCGCNCNIQYYCIEVEEDNSQAGRK